MWPWSLSLHHSSTIWAWTEKQRAVMSLRKKIKTFTIYLAIYYIFEYKISIEGRGKHLAIQLLEASARLSVTRISLM